MEVAVLRNEVDSLRKEGFYNAARRGVEVQYLLHK
jgi:hypothetical protein